MSWYLTSNYVPSIPFGRATERRKETGSPELQPLSVYIDGSVVPRSERNDNYNQLGADLSKYLLVAPGDLVFNRLRTWQGGFGVSNYDGIVSPAYFVCRPLEGFIPNFLGYLMRSSLYLAELTRLSKFMPPSQFDILWDDLRLVPVPTREVAEQEAIAQFLDTETARIDAVAAQTRSLAALLSERQLTNVFEAVTGGDWKGPLRNSGLSWVDKLPAHWGAPWLGANYETQLGKMLDAEAAAGDKPAPYVRNVNVQWDRIDLANLASMSFSDSDRVRCELRGGDLLVCEGGEVGRAAVWPGDVKGIYFQKAIHRVRPLKDGNTRFLMYCLRAAAHLNVFAVEGNQSTIVHLTGEKLREHRFPFPPLNEQESIVRRLDEDRDRTKAMTDALERQIALLQERRQALITAAVTGEMEIPGVPA